MTRRTILIAAVLLLLAVGFYLNRGEDPVSVRVAAVERGEVRKTVSNTRVGTVKPCRRAYLAPATGDKLVKLEVREGDGVKRGQVLMEVWNEDLRARLKLEAAQVKTRQASARRACHVADGAEREANRLRKLTSRNNIISRERVDRAVTEALAARASCNSEKAAIRVSQARYEVAEAALERSLVRAPFDGTVAEINVELGEYVTPSPPGIPTLPAIDLLDLSCLYVSAPIDEVDAPLIRVGMPACLSLDAFEGKRCSGTVSRIAPYVLEKEKQARTVEVEVKLTDPRDLKDLLPGYSADIEVLIDTRDSTLRIPTEAVSGGDRVLVLGADGVLDRRRFEPGVSNWEYTEVLSGLEAGEQVVTSVGREGVEEGVRAVADGASLR